MTVASARIGLTVAGAVLRWLEDSITEDGRARHAGHASLIVP